MVGARVTAHQALRAEPSSSSASGWACVKVMAPPPLSAKAEYDDRIVSSPLTRTAEQDPKRTTPQLVWQGLQRLIR
jgi:hypothetical protein